VSRKPTYLRDVRDTREPANLRCDWLQSRIFHVSNVIVTNHIVITRRLNENSTVFVVIKGPFIEEKLMKAACAAIMRYEPYSVILSGGSVTDH
jgi:hypothetical protein